MVRMNGVRNFNGLKIVFVRDKIFLCVGGWELMLILKWNELDFIYY